MASSKIYKAPNILNSRGSTLGDVAQSGVNPVTGEYLTTEQRKALFRKRSVSSQKVFGKSGALIKVTPYSIKPIEREEKQEKGSIVKTLSVSTLTKRIGVLEAQVTVLSNIIKKEAEIEDKLDKERIRKENIEEEKESRKVKETGLEKKISSFLLGPVKAVAGKAQGILSTLMEFFSLLFVGWLTDKGLLAIKLNSEGNIKALEDLKNSVIKNLAIVGGIFAVLNIGLLRTIGLIASITFGIGKWLASNTIGRLFNALRRGLRPPAPPITPPITPPVTPPSGSRAGFNAGVKGSTSGRATGITKAGSTFDLEQQRRALTQQRMLQQEGPRGPLGSLQKTLRAKLAQFETSNLGRTLGKVSTFLRGNILGKLPFAGKFLGAVDAAKQFASKEGVKKFGTGLGKLFRRSLGILNAVLTLGDISGRAQQGMTPAQAIIPALLKALLTSGGAILGGTVPIPGVNLLTSVAGSYAGNWLGGQIQNWLDSQWDPSWDSSLFKGFNDTIRSIGSADPSGIVNSLFPYGAGVVKTAKGQYKVYDINSTYKPGEIVSLGNKLYTIDQSGALGQEYTGMANIPPQEGTGMGSPTDMDLTPPSADVSPIPTQSYVPSQEPPAAPNVVYRRSGGGKRGQGTTLNSGSATGVPLIPSSNPDNFYTLYSQINYNVVM